MSRIKNSWMFARFLRKESEIRDEHFDDEYHYDKYRKQLEEEQQYYEEHPESSKNKNKK